MNTERITALRDHLQDIINNGDSVLFDMSDYFTWQAQLSWDENVPTIQQAIDGTIDCGTACCLAGHTAIIFQDYLLPGELNAHSTCATFAVTQRLLGLTEAQALELFLPGEIVWEDTTPEEAIHTLNILLETGKVRWKV